MAALRGLWVAILCLFATQAAAETLPLRLSSGAVIDARLVKPEAAPGALPAIVLLGGFRRGAAALDLLPQAADAVLVGLDYPVEIPRHPKWHEILPLAGRIEGGIAQTIEALGLLHAALAARRDVDPRRISIVGVSLGSPFAVIAASRSDYRGVVLVHAFADVPRTLRHQFARRWQPRYGALGTAAAWLAQQAIGCLVEAPEPADYAERLRADQRVYLLRAADDEFVPAASSQALLDALSRSAAAVTVEEMPGRHVRGRDAERVEQLYGRATAWMRREGLL